MNIEKYLGSYRPPITNVVDRLRYWSEAKADKAGYRYLVDGETEEESLTYAELDRQARAIGASLAARNLEGERALLLFPPGLEFVAAFFGCLYAGVTPVPAYPPRRNRNMTRIQAISDDAAAKVALTIDSVATRVGKMLDEAPNLRRLEWISTDKTDWNLADKWVRPDIHDETLAVLQYTSGSTGTPKGVMLTHANLMHNCSLITYSFEPARHGVGLSWLPTYHDMGLVGGVLQPMFYGRPNVLMSPMAFMQKPIRWLKAISRLGITISGGPNFAYELCTEKTTAEDLEGIDLSSWDLAFNGAEPIRAETLERFNEKFAPYGFSPTAHFPCYGMAETTLIVTGAYKDKPPLIRTFDGAALDQHRVAPAESGGADARSLVSCGRILPEEEIALVDPDTCRPVGDNTVGEIWVISPSMGKGYWRKPVETAETFAAKIDGSVDGKTYLRTGDLGFVSEGELYVTGRVKDLIIVRGVNRYPQDIEATVEGVSERLRSSSTAAFALDVQGRERLVVVAEVERSRNKEWGDVIAAIRSAITIEHDLPPDAVILVRAGSIPKTSSGKIQRHATRDDFLNGDLSIVADWRLWKTDALFDKQSDPPAVTRQKPAEKAAAPALPANQRVLDVVMDQVRLLAKERGKTLHADSNIVVDIGLDSLERLQVANALEQIFGGRFPDEVLERIETVREVALAIEQYIGDRPLAEPIPFDNTARLKAISSSGAARRQGTPAPKNTEGPYADYCKFDKMPEYVRLKKTMGLLSSLDAPNPYFDVHDSVADDTTFINGRSLINFSSYNYLGMSGDPSVADAAKEAINSYGTGASSSRMFAGELPLHRQLELALARFLGVGDALTFVGGHVTNETTIGHLLGPGDLVVHDSLAHSSIVKGAELSGARRRPFPHNDWQALDNLLTEVRHDFRRVLIVVEGVYSMDGDIVNLPQFVELKEKHKTFLMVDEAHSFGVLGSTGRGVSEHFGIAADRVDLWMGTLSKSLGSCGGFIAGSKELIEYLRYTAPGFVFETGLPPAGAAAAIRALELLEQQPERVRQLRANSELFLGKAREAQLNVGLSEQSPVIPVIIGNSVNALQLSYNLNRRGINVQPILHPAVDEEKTRLRFFITSRHTVDQIESTVAALTEELARLSLEEAPPA
ncbi:aminotransferase class I/II-fold pyridoxal phosphate-dependent enzyme [Lignipirellula cremea]|uniref:aminotransferase class I/II-fold pyridoxal phosphate-dependent enzyme n=1 Tax=Lignipirellula cremea TaxID=2528010 RepID=UPI0011A794DC|nr:aminotransferase class I/II-fold pyridoxal phosphate-dependent enzyme [Lignipirellula cremea]